MRDYSINICGRFLTFVLILLTGCSLLSGNDQSIGESYFPLEVGAEWSYELVQGEGFAADSLEHFTVKVTDTETVDGTKYYVVENYFVPEPLSADKRLIRREGNWIYTRIDGKDHLLYSFGEEGDTWTVSRINKLELDPSYDTPMVPAKLTALTADTAAIAWNLRGFPGPDPNPGRVSGTEQQRGEIHSGWGELFAKGKGRAQLVWVSQAYGTLVWRGELR
jgi:hypothetical protein